MAEWWEETGGEQLDALFLVQPACARQLGLEAVLVLLDRTSSVTCRQFAERVGAKRRPIAQVEEVLEVAPGGCALILLDLVIP